MSPYECQRAWNAAAYAIQKGRSICAEYGHEHLETWLFGEECERTLEFIADTDHPEPVDVMNLYSLLGLNRTDKRDPARAGDCLSLRITGMKWGYQFMSLLEDPTEAMR